MLEQCKSCNYLLEDDYCNAIGHYLSEHPVTKCHENEPHDIWIKQDDDTYTCANHCGYVTKTLFKYCPECNTPMKNGKVKNEQPTPFFLREIQRCPEKHKKFFHCTNCNYNFIAGNDRYTLIDSNPDVMGWISETYQCLCPKCKQEVICSELF